MAYPFVASPHVTRTSGRQIDLVVLHTIESDERSDSAESCARWFQQPEARVSAHYCVDGDSIVQCVRDQDVAWHAPGANHDGLGLELAGRARQTRREWNDSYSAALVVRAAGLTAELCRRHAIPAAWLYAPDLRAGRRGITTHAAVNDAYGRGDHRDPGPHFPAERFLVLVRAGLGHVREPPPLRGDPPTLRRGSTGWQVKRLQRLLLARGHLSGEREVDGVFGEVTEAAVQAFQHVAALEVDGIVGPLTWHALIAALL